MTAVCDLTAWTPKQHPARRSIEGRYVSLEPLDADRHGDDLYAIATLPDASALYRYLAERPPADRAAFQGWLQWAQASLDPMFFAVIDRRTGKAAGRQAFMRIEAAHGCIEIGSILWGPDIARTAAATEAHYLFMRHAFEDLGYRRWEWKCNALNAPSIRAAERFGFTPEGVFRQHMVVKGENRDTAWFAILDHEWREHKQAYEAWLAPENFAADGRQLRRLQEFRTAP